MKEIQHDHFFPLKNVGHGMHLRPSLPMKNLNSKVNSHAKKKKKLLTNKIDNYHQDTNKNARHSLWLFQSSFFFFKEEKN